MIRAGRLMVLASLGGAGGNAPAFNKDTKAGFGYPSRTLHNSLLTDSKLERLNAQVNRRSSTRSPTVSRASDS